jgi:hypothetical protein
MHLTNTDPKGHDLAVVSKETAGAPEEIEVTAEMLSTGAAALERYYLGDGRYDLSDVCLAAVFKEMARGRLSPCPPIHESDR